MNRNRPPSTQELLQLVELVYGWAVGSRTPGEVMHVLNQCLGEVFTQTAVKTSQDGRARGSQVVNAVLEDEERHQEDGKDGDAPDPGVPLFTSPPSDDLLGRNAEKLDERLVAPVAFYRDVLVPNGFGWAIGDACERWEGAATKVGGFGSVDSTPEWIATTLRYLLPHFQLASQMRARLQHQELTTRSASELLEMLPTPCLFTDRVGRCIEGNEAFRRSLEPLAMRLVVGRLRFADPDLQIHWETALSETHTTALRRTLSAKASDGRKWRLHLIPWHPVQRAPVGSESKMILVFFEQMRAVLQAQGQPAALALKAGLTRAELDVMTSLLQGLPAKAIATQRRASFNTVRSQIVAILEKTGHRSQKELIASVSSSVMPSGDHSGF